MARRFKHLTKTDRLRMEQQLKDGKGAKEIAENLGVHISTIYREKKRGQYEHRNSDWTTEIRYSPDIAHSHRYRENLKAKGPELETGGRIASSPNISSTRSPTSNTALRRCWEGSRRRV